METAVQGVRAPSSVTIPRNAPSTLVANENDDPVQTIYQWESRVKVHKKQSGDKVSENIKLAVLQKFLCDGELARHLNLQPARLTTHYLARKKAINNLRAKQTWTASGSSDPMDLSLLGKGKGGKKGNGKGKGDRSAKPKECFHCGKPDHNKIKLLSCPEERNLFTPSRLEGWSVRRCGSGSRDRQEKTF